MHFTPYIETQEIIRDDIFSQNVEKVPFLEELAMDETEGDNGENDMEFEDNTTVPIYTNYYNHTSGHIEFINDFKNNSFGHSCAICDRLWCKNELSMTSDQHNNILKKILPNYVRGSHVKVCSTCKAALNKQKIPLLSVYNGFSYPAIPSHLPKLNLVEQRLISPRIPFMQIRSLKHNHGQYNIYGQIINFPLEVNTMVKQLPRNIEDDHCFYVDIEKKLIHKTSYLHGLINKKNIKEWLSFLVTTPLYIHHDIKIDESQSVEDDISEYLPEDNVIAQQQTLLWNKDKLLLMTAGEIYAPLSILFDEYAEELSFPTIYGGQFRKYRDEIYVSPFMQANSELRRTDRRATNPQHLLYLAVKLMRIRVSQSVNIAFKQVDHDTKIKKENVESEEYIINCIESNLAFLRCIPNSVGYWSDRKKDLFAMIRQLGAPTAFMSLSANETGWTDLLNVLCILKNDGTIISDKFLTEMSYAHKAQLVNEDAITCAIYFNKLVNCILKILQAKKRSPFGMYRVSDYYKRIEFEHGGSPHAHILLWLDNAPKDLLSNNNDVIQLIDELVSVSESEASGNIKLQTHKHTFKCFKKMDSNKKRNCKYGAPFMPMKKTISLINMKDTDSDFSEEVFKKYQKHYFSIKTNLENFEYKDFDDFYSHNNIISDEHYYNIIRAGINRPKLFYRRKPSEKWYNSFNPFVLHHLKSNMDFQIIQDEYSCAAYVVEYVNKHNRGISNLQKQIIEIMDEHPEFDIYDTTKKISIDLLNSVEMSVQEAAWYLLREPMAQSSITTAYIPTILPSERQRIRKTMNELSALDDDCMDLWKENWFDKYEKRPDELNDITFAQFVAKYTINLKGIWTERKKFKVIRYRNYDIDDDLNNHMREMVLLHIPFRSEENDILAENKFIQIYKDNKDLILERRKEFESNLDIAKTLEICKQLCIENEDEDEDEELQRHANIIFDKDLCDPLSQDPHPNFNTDLQNASLSELGSIDEKRENLMDREQLSTRVEQPTEPHISSIALNEFFDPEDQLFEFMRMASDEQKELLMHIIRRVQTPNELPFQIFFTSPAGTGRTFVIRLIIEIYNKFSDNDGYCNAYVTCSSTCKATEAINGTAVYTALKISISKLLLLSTEILHSYRSFFKYVKLLIIDEISMISAETLVKIDLCLKQITGNHIADFGNLDVILIGDLRQLSPVGETAISKAVKTHMVGPYLWRKLKLFELTTVMRQVNVAFSKILSKIGNGDLLDQNEKELLESRFVKKTYADRFCSNGVRLFFKNSDADAYNSSILQKCEDKVISTANDVIIGCENCEEEASFRTKLHNKSVSDTGGLPHQITFVIGKHYLITINIDASDGLCNGAVGKLLHIESDQNNTAHRVWIEFCDLKNVGKKKRLKTAGLVTKNGLNLAVPIELRTVNITLSSNKKVIAKRKHFPLIPACAMTIYKSHGGTLDKIVYEYNKEHSQELVSLALSRVKNIENLYIVTSDDDATKFKFYHERKQVALLTEFKRLSLDTIRAKAKTIVDFIYNRKGISILTFNCENLMRQNQNLTDVATKKTNILLLSETRMTYDGNIDTPNFNCIVKYKSDDVRTGGVTMYHNKDDVANILTPSMEIIISNTNDISVRHTNVGDICTAVCKMDNGVEIVMVVVYISPNSKMSDIKYFIHSSLILYSEEIAHILNRDDYQLPLILAGDFNVNFADEESKALKTFLWDKFNLTMNNNSVESTMRYGTSIDAVFSRFLEKIESQTYVTYFSHLKKEGRSLRKIRSKPS